MAIFLTRLALTSSLDTGIVADAPENTVTFRITYLRGHYGSQMVSSVNSLAETGSYVAGDDPFDFSPYMDQVRSISFLKMMLG